MEKSGLNQAIPHQDYEPPATGLSVPDPGSGPKRVSVNYRYDTIYPEFLRFLAEIGAYAAEKYGTAEQYFTTGHRLSGEKGPINHVYNHLREYQLGIPHDHFGADPRRQLASAAYNLMMEFVYVSQGHQPDTVWNWQTDKSPVAVQPIVHTAVPGTIFQEDQGDENDASESGGSTLLRRLFNL